MVELAFFSCDLGFTLPVHDWVQNKKERKKVREVGILKKDPDAIKEQIQKLEIMSVWFFLSCTSVAHLLRRLSLICTIDLI